MGTANEARDIAPSVTKQEMQAHKITTLTPNSTPGQDSQIQYIFQANDVSCKRGKRHGTWGEKGKGLTIFGP